jgi:hypothetical protein
MKLLPILALSLFATSAFAETLDKLYEEFRTELRTELKSALDKGNAENNGRLLRLEELMIAELPADSLNGANPKAVIAALTQIRGMTKSEKADALALQLVAEMRKAKERKETEFKEKFSTSLRQAAETMLKATKASELDEPLGNVQELQKQAAKMGQFEDGGIFKGVELDQAQALQQLMSQWQDAMLAQSNPNSNRNPAEVLEGGLSNYTRSLNSLVPRSVLERIRAMRQNGQPAAAKRLTLAELETRSREVYRSIEKLDDLAPAIAKLEGLIAQSREPGSSGGSYGNESQALAVLRSYRKNYEDLKSGMAVSLAFTSPYQTSGTYPGPDDQAVLRGLLLRFAVPRILQAKEGAKESENLAEYLARMSDLARTEKNWTLLGRILDTAQTLNIAVVATANDAAALRQMLAGVNQEKARQFSGAVASYLGALKSGSQAVPAEWIGEKLEAIRKASPESYERGEIRASAPEGGGGAEADANPRSGYPTQRGNPSDTRFIQIPAAPKPVTPADKAPVPPPNQIPKAALTEEPPKVPSPAPNPAR